MGVFYSVRLECMDERTMSTILTVIHVVTNGVGEYGLVHSLRAETIEGIHMTRNHTYISHITIL